MILNLGHQSDDFFCTFEEIIYNKVQRAQLKDLLLLLNKKNDRQIILIFSNGKFFKIKLLRG